MIKYEHSINYFSCEKLLNFDLLYQYNFKNINLLPKLKKIKLVFSLNDKKNLFSFSNDFKVNSIFYLFLSLGCMPCIKSEFVKKYSLKNINNEESENFNLEFYITKKNLLFNFLLFFSFFNNLYKNFSVINLNLKTNKTFLKIKYQVPIYTIFELCDTTFYSLFNINFKNFLVNIYFLIEYKKSFF